MERHVKTFLLRNIYKYTISYLFLCKNVIVMSSQTASIRTRAAEIWCYPGQKMEILQELNVLWKM